MRKLLPYLIFNGNCREAMEYYAIVFDGYIVKMQTFEDAPVDIPGNERNRIYDSEMTVGAITIKASDGLPDQDVMSGMNISLFIAFDSKQDQKKVYNNFLPEANVNFELSEQSDFAMLTDKYGISWMLAYHP